MVVTVKITFKDCVRAVCTFDKEQLPATINAVLWFYNRRNFYVCSLCDSPTYVLGYWFLQVPKSTTGSPRKTLVSENRWAWLHP